MLEFIVKRCENTLKHLKSQNNEVAHLVEALEKVTKIKRNPIATFTNISLRHRIMKKLGEHHRRRTLLLSKCRMDSSDLKSSERSKSRNSKKYF